MRGVAGVRFKDGVVKLAPFELIRNHDKTPFSPQSTQDFPKETVWVKWQKSMIHQDILNDGYYEANILLLAKTVETAMAKAAELKLRLPACPLIPLPPRSPSKSSSSRLRARDSKMNSKSSSKIETTKQHSSSRPDKSKEKKLGSDKQDDVCSKSKSSKRKGSEPLQSLDENQSSGESDAKKRKDNAAAKDPVASSRLSKVLSVAQVQNPVFMKTLSEQLVTKPSPLKTPPSSIRSLKVGTPPLFTPTPMSVKKQLFSSSKKDSDNLMEEPVESRNNSVKIQSVVSSTPHKGNHTSGDIKGDDIEYFGNGSDNELELNNKKEETASVQDNHSNDDLNESGQGKDSSQDSDSDLESTLPVSYQNVKSDSSSSSAHSDSDSVDSKSMLLDDQKKLYDNLKKVKSELAESKRQLTVSNNLRLKYKEQKETLEKTVESQREKIASLQEHICNMLMGETSTKSNKSAKSKVSKVENFSHESKKGSSKSSSKKIKKPAVKLDNEEIVTTCDLVLNHLKGTAPLPVDQDDKVTIGIVKNGEETKDIKIKRKQMEQNFEDNKLDLKKFAKNVTAMVWDRDERINRSLTGAVNNKHQIPKATATPSKVNAVLGVCKAHMLHLGDKEGPSMLNSLTLCEKAIGEKFATDALAESRRKN